MLSLIISVHNVSLSWLMIQSSDCHHLFCWFSKQLQFPVIILWNIAQSIGQFNSDRKDPYKNIQNIDTIERNATWQNMHSWDRQENPTTALTVRDYREKSQIYHDSVTNEIEYELIDSCMHSTCQRSVNAIMHCTSTHTPICIYFLLDFCKKKLFIRYI